MAVRVTTGAPTGTALAPTGLTTVPDDGLLYQTGRVRLCRISGPAGGLLRRELLGPDWEPRLRREQAMLRRLAGTTGVPRLVESLPYPQSIILAGAPGRPLAAGTLPLPGPTLVTVAAGLARALSAVHRQGIILRGLTPATVMVTPDGRDPHLIDFSLASPAGPDPAPGPPELSHPHEIADALPYLAPEQTGRTGRTVDQRADLYALGATLYALATGTPPFGTGDPLRLSHDQLARTPVPPHQLNPAVVPALSHIIMRLLAKEPDNRYQSADGVAHDLSQLARAPTEVQLPIGAHDFPARLQPPAHLVGREAEIATLERAFRAARSGQCRGVLISGPPGAGKTSLVDELRPAVATAGGRFVTGKFDRYRQDPDFDAVRQAYRSLARLLLAEPEEQLVGLRSRLLHTLGEQAAVVAAVVPELGPLLRISPATSVGDPLTLQARLARTALGMLREIASPQRPVVLFIDDLQWASRTPLEAIDLLFTDTGAGRTLDGVLVVGAYRDEQVTAGHPLANLLERWHQQRVPVTPLRLGNLPAPAQTRLVAEMLRLPSRRSATLAEALAPATGGNPYEMVELLNSLRREGVLTPDPDGWHWDDTVLRRRLGHADVTRLVTERAAAMPPTTRLLLRTMACLGGQAEPALLEAATGVPEPYLTAWLEPALTEGLLVREPADVGEVRFRHDRVQEAVLAGMPPHRRRALRLRLARRLAQHQTDRPALAPVAAEQYLAVVDGIQAPAEARRVAELLRRAAGQAQQLSNHAAVERLLAAAVTLTDPADRSALIELNTGRHGALFSLGRLSEADAAFQAMLDLEPTPAQRLAATSVQVASLSNRNRNAQAVALGLALLRDLGHDPPAAGTRPDPAIDLAPLDRWLGQDPAADLRRPDVTDPVLVDTGTLISRMMAPAYFCNQAVLAWLALEAVRMWSAHGPCQTLVAPVAHTPFVAVALRGDYRVGRRVLRRVLAVAERRGYEPDTSEALFLYGIGVGHWLEPLEEQAARVQRAREGLLRGGNLQKASHTYFVSAYTLLDAEPSLDSYATEVEAGLAFAQRIGSDEAAANLAVYRRLVGLLRDEQRRPPDPEGGGPAGPEPEGAGPAGPDPEPPDPAGPDPEGNANVAVNHQVTRALAAAIFGDQAALSRHSAAAARMLGLVPGIYPTAVGHLLRALALAAEVRAAAPDQPGRLAALDTEVAWLAERAADAPDNFAHLWRLATAERAWAAGDLAAAVGGYDLAQRTAEARVRPWHRALIAERAAAFYLAQGADRIARTMLREARHGYLTWGATAKVAQLDRTHPELVPPRAGPDAPAPGADVLTGAIDLVGVLAASQALSSEKGIEGLRARVVEVLSAMTGATGVQLLIREPGEPDWLVAMPAGAPAMPLTTPAGRALVPVSAVWYAERTRDPLVVADATRDDRFARDPYLAPLERCALLVVPIVNQDTLRALVVLENRLIHGVFSADRLDGVMLIASQLAVSLDNATVYASLERKVLERTEELALANRRLARLSATDPLTDLANRRSLEQILNAEWSRAQLSRSPVALAMVDIDYFKLYNDHHGHGAGDRCLQEVSRVLRDQVRGSDLVARYGGEEFAVVMPDAGVATAIEVAERLRAAVAAMAEPSPLAPERIVTVSVGVTAVVPAPGVSLRDLVDRADAELYRAKRAGRNRVRPAAG